MDKYPKMPDIRIMLIIKEIFKCNNSNINEQKTKWYQNY